MSPRPSGPIRLSVVTTLYRSAPHLEQFCRRVVAVADTLTPEFELVLVNDGSPDDSLATARRLLQDEPRLRIIDLARNYGHYPAMMAGLRESRGGRVFLIDCDLEEPPELLARFWGELDADADLDLVYGEQGHRRGRWGDRVLGRAYYALVGSVSPVSVSPSPVVARLATRPYVEALLAHGEAPISFDALSALAGFRQKGIEVVKASSSPSTYTLRRKVSLVLRTGLAFGEIPFKVVGVLGLLMAITATLWAVVALVRGSPLTAGGVLIASVWFLGGAILAAIAVLGFYTSIVLNEVRRRPTVVRRRYGRD